MILTLKLFGMLILVFGLAGCGSPPPQKGNYSPSVRQADFADQLDGTSWTGLGVQTNGSRWSILAQFQGKGAQTLYYDGDCVARWTLIEQNASSATYREEIVNSSRCIDTIVTVYEVGAGKLGYRVRRTTGGSVIATSTLIRTASEVSPAAINIPQLVEPVTTPAAPQTVRDCGTRPKRPSIPSRPAGLSCSSRAIELRLDTCTATGVAEVVCGEALEASDTRISTGALNGAACSAGTAIAQGKTPNSGDVAGSAIIGAVDNAGESVGGLWGGLIRVAAAGVKAGLVAECRRDVRVQCDPESALIPYRNRLANYEACLAK